MDHRIERRRQRASAYLRSGQLPAAVAAFESLLGEAPDDDAARLELSLLLLHQGRYRQAHAQAMLACQRHPEDPALARVRIEALRAFAEHGRLHELARKVVDLDAIEPTDLTAGASALLAVGAVDAAASWIGAAVRRRPADPVARVVRAMTALDRGLRDDAEADLEAVIGSGPVVPMAHWLLAILRRQTPARNHVPRLRQSLGAMPDGSEDQAHLAFALHKELDDLDEADEAWEALERGLAAKRRALAFDDAADHALFERLESTLPGPDLDRTNAKAGAPVPIFIVGMHRSGTSLLERILEGHPQVAVGGESQRLSARLRLAANHNSRGPVDITLLDRLGSADLTDVAEDYLGAHDWLLRGRSHFTEKLPENYQLIGLIHRLLPQAKVVHLVRDPMDTGWSNLRELFAGRALPFTYDQVALGRRFVRYRRLMRHWHDTLPGFVLDLRYEDLVRDPEAAARRVFQHCGLAWSHGCTEVEALDTPVRTASAMQVREPIHQRSLGRWLRYARHLEPLRRTLADAGLVE